MLKSWSWITVVVFYAVLSLWYFHAERSYKIFNGDSAGYYAYLPAFVSNQDFQFEDLKAEENQAKVYSNYRIKKDGKILNKYPIGVAILLLPFYLIGLLIGSGPYETSMQFMILLGSVFYLGLASHCFDQICRRLNYNRWLAAILFIGTNLVYYVIAEPLMSHLYSLSGFCVILYFIIKFIDTEQRKWLTFIGLAVGLLITVRPINVIGVLMLPFVLELFGSNLTHFGKLLKGKYKNLLWGLLPISIQCLAWYLQTGSPIIWSYANEGFNWLEPHIWEVWFSFKKGLFIYVPILLILFVALVQSVRKRQKSGLLFIIPFIIISYIISCWWSWYYGDSFGHRAFIEFYPFLFLVILNGLKNQKRDWLMPTLCAPLILLNLIQTWQYEKGIIHPNSMDVNKYAHIFLKTDDAYIGCLGNEQEAVPYGARKELIEQKNWHEISVAGQPYLMSLEVTSNQELFIALDAKKYSATPINYKGTFLTAQGFNADGSTKFIKTLPYYDINTESYGEWTKLHTEIVIPQASMVRIYIWNQQKLHFMLKDISLKIFELVRK